MKIEFYCDGCGATTTKEIEENVHTDIYCYSCEREITTIRVLKEEVKE